MDEGSDLKQLDPMQLRDYRLGKERSWYLSVEGFLDFVRDSGIAPLAQEEPHGVGAHQILNWTARHDPEAPDRDLFFYKMVLWPRGSFKSTVFTIGYACWLIANDPNIRILVCSETSKQAIPLVEQIKQVIDSPWFKTRFGVHKGRKWVRGAFYSAQRTRLEIKEPTLQATGVGEVRTGSHWDHVIMDDVCSQENTKTAESLNKMWDWFGETLAQLDPGCKLLVIGTLHHFDDIYCRIRKADNIARLFEKSIHAWCEPLIDPSSKEETKLFFPGRLTRAYVADQKALMTSRLFACFYENQPTTAADQIFKKEHFRVIENRDVPQHLWTYIFTDFAFIAEEKKKGRADRTCFWIVGLDCTRTAYVLDFYVGRWRPNDSVRLACNLWNHYQDLNMRGIVVEDTTHKELISSLFEEIRRKTFIHPRIIPIPGRGQETKEIRIESLEVRFKKGNIYFARSLRDQAREKWNPMINEMLEWPFSAHDDIPDALSDLDKVDKNGRYHCPNPPPGWRTDVVRTYQPTMIDGKFNPDLGYPAREMVKRTQQRGDQLWQQNPEQASQSQSIFRRPPPSPGRLTGF